MMKVGFHDELGASPFVVLKDAKGVEHYARLAVGTGLPSVGVQATLGVDGRGMMRVVPGIARGAGLGL
ncbi:hypothetical protein D3C81_1788240 [compost metagenome]